VFCNCDDPTWSNFWKFFHLKFGEWGLKKLISTHYDAEKSTYKMEYEGGDDGNTEAGVVTPLSQNGDFRSSECIELLKEADIVVTNPPFSLFREYIAQLMEHKKKFVIIGNKNAITYKEIFPFIRDNKLWIGYTGMGKDFLFRVPDEHIEALKKKSKSGSAYRIVDGIVYARSQSCWFTNLDHQKRHEPIDLVEKYDPERYPTYDNYDAINVDKTLDIPKDYVPCWFHCEHATSCVYAQTKGMTDDALCEHACNGEMGVPISFLDKYCPEQFSLVGNGGSYSGEGSVADELFVPADTCSQIVQVERERERERERDGSARCTNALSFVGCRKCNGIIGVPISFLDKYCPEQFRIIWTTDRGGDGRLEWCKKQHTRFDAPVIRGGGLYKRIFIQKV